MCGNYGIAFLDKNGKGFSETEPLLVFFDKNDTIHHVKDEIMELIHSGCENITVFRYDKWYDEEPEGYLDWNWIIQRKVEI